MTSNRPLLLPAVKVKSAAGWKGRDKAHLGISLHNPNLSGAPLAAIVEWINGQHFSELFVDLSDTLHRHNIMLEQNVDEETARQKALADGDEWLKENYATLQKLKIPFRLYRWDEWRLFPQVRAYHEQFKDAFRRDGAFRDAVCADILRFAARTGAAPAENFMAAGVNYLLEELAVLSFYFEDYPCAKLYPGREQACFRLVREGHVADIPAGLSNVFYTQLWLHSEPVAAEPPDKAANANTKAR